MASFLKRTANASFVPRLLSIGPQRLPRSSRLQFEMPWADNEPLVQRLEWREASYE